MSKDIEYMIKHLPEDATYIKLRLNGNSDTLALVRKIIDASVNHLSLNAALLNDLTNNDKALDYLEKAWFLDQSSSETGEMLAETAKGLGKSVMVDVVGYNVILSEPEVSTGIFKFQ